MLVVNDDFQLRGMITVKDIQKSSEHPFACKNEQGQLRAGAAVGVGAGTDEPNFAALVQQPHRREMTNPSYYQQHKQEDATRARSSFMSIAKSLRATSIFA